MAVLSLSIVESEEQIVFGIPRTITIETNLPSTIYYTIDGSTPNTFSSIYLDPIILPTNQLQIILNVIATDGIVTTSVVTKTYFTEAVLDPAKQLSATSENSGDFNNYPFGSRLTSSNVKLGVSANAGTTVDSPSIPNVEKVYDQNGNETGGQDKPLLTSYKNIFTTTDSKGQVYKGVGTLPASVKYILPNPIPEESKASDKLFNPKALVIFQDYSPNSSDPLEPVILNRPNFTLEDPEKVRSYNLFYSCGLDAPTTTGSFIKSFYNPKDNTTTYYYYDSQALRWIISKQVNVIKDPKINNYSNMVMPRGEGRGFVFKWIPFMHRHLT